jgi:hypothetical protein
MNRSLPPLLPWLGLAGLIPFLAAAGLAWAAPTPGLRAEALWALAAYGAVILSFLGAVHWGLALAAPSGGDEAAATPARLVLGVIPSLVAWLALLLPVASGLALLALGIVIIAWIESIAARKGLLMRDYLRLRWLLSGGAAVSLLGGAIIS